MQKLYLQKNKQKIYISVLVLGADKVWKSLPEPYRGQEVEVEEIVGKMFGMLEVFSTISHFDFLHSTDKTKLTNSLKYISKTI